MFACLATEYDGNKEQVAHVLLLCPTAQRTKISLSVNCVGLTPMIFSNQLQKNAFCVVSDSGTIAEEGSYFKFPAVSVRTSTERPEALDKGNMVIGSITTEQVLQAVDMAVEMYQNGDVGLDVPNYIDENVSIKVVKIIQSYTGIVNKMVWRK